jgi:hypothetical protein
VSSPALKEWSAAVHAMLDGRQTVLLRKGGIHEKRFDVDAEEFVFFPTVAHGHADRVRPEHRRFLEPATADSTESALTIRAGARVVAAIPVDHPDGLDALADTHIWTTESIRTDRLDFRPRHRLTVLVVSVRPLLLPVSMPRDPAYAGCKSWVDLPIAPEWGDPVHDARFLDAVAGRVAAAVG